MANITAKCDFCDKPATFDAKLKNMHSWAYMCDEHFEQHGSKILGLFKRLDESKGPLKKCLTCGQEKPLYEFYNYNDKAGVLRYRGSCKECELADKKRRYNRCKKSMREN